MILWIDEWGQAHETSVLDTSLVDAVKDSIADVYRFNKETEHYQQYFDNKWGEIQRKEL